MEITYKIKSTNKQKVKAISESLVIPKSILHVLVNRSIDTEEKITAFLHPTHEALHDPYLLPDMQTAVDRIESAIVHNETILVHGDYDADGICSTALLVHALRGFGGKAEYYVPNRLEEGYGLKREGVDYAEKIGAELIITCDCGISSGEEVEIASSKGIDVIITDHHEAGEDLPKSVAIVNPKLETSTYPFDGLAGVGVTAKLVLALYQKRSLEPPLTNILRICAIGTIADSVSLKDENRFIAQHGLQYLSGTQNIGLLSLFRIAGLHGKNISSYDVAFRIAPRINAAGRFGKHELALDLLFSRDMSAATDLAKVLNDLNAERQQLVDTMVQDAIDLVKGIPESANHNVLVVAKSGWNRGLVGLVASKLVEKYNKPTFAIAIEGDVGHGSARSISDFDLFENMQRIGTLFTRYGGHKLAAGFELSVDRISELRDELVRLSASEITSDLSVKEIEVDAEIEFKELDDSFLTFYKKLEPFGQDNEKPIFMSKNVRISSDLIILKDKHLKLRVTQEGFAGSITALAWNMSDRSSELVPGKQFTLIYTVEINSWKGKQELQLSIIDFLQSN